MAAKDVNIRFGLIFDQKSLARVENQLRRSGEKLNRLGDSLSIAVSAPLAALGAGAIKAAGDLESLTLALKSQLGSAALAQKELAALNEVAKLPGLGLEQVVRGSVSLQAVGRSAESARDILVEFGNGLALAGKGRAELDGVVLALTQITAKGKVSAEEINQLAERLPQIRTLMKNAFGTASTEEIQKLGITSEKFIDGILKQLKELPRAQGGIKNSIENTLDSLKQSLAKVGFAINKTFDIAGSAEAFGNFVLGMAEAFDSLNPALQKLAVGFAATLVAAGPLAKVFGAFQLLGAQAIGVWSGMVGGLKSLSTWATNVATAFNALNFATRAFIVLGVVTAIYTAAVALGVFNRELTQAEKTQQLLNDVNREAVRSISAERAAIDPLIATLNDENKTRERKAAALGELKRIAPQYFGDLTEEDIKVGKLNIAYEKYIENLLRAARAKGAEEKLIKNDQERLDLAEKLLRLQNAPKGAGAANVGLGSGLVQDIQAKNTADQLIRQVKEKIEANAAEKRALIELVQANTDLAAVQTATANTTIDNTKADRDATKAVKDKTKALEEQASEMDRIVDSLLEMNEQGKSAETAFLRDVVLPQNDLPDDGGGLATDTTDLGNGLASLDLGKNLTPLLSTVELLTIALQNAKAASDDFMSNFQTKTQIAADAIGSLGGAIASTLSDSAASWGDFAKTTLMAIGDVIGALIKLTVAKAIASAIDKGAAINPLIGIALAGLAGTLAAAVFKKGVSSANFDAFARGTQFAPGGLALVGERGPELVNVPRGSSIASNSRTNRVLNGMGGSMEITGEFRMQGDVLLAGVERATQKQKRTRGY